MVRIISGSESASASVIKDMVRNFSNPKDTDADTDISHADIRPDMVEDMVLLLSDGCGLSADNPRIIRPF